MEPTAARTHPLRDFVLGRQWRGRTYLISPLVDVLMVGGLGLILAALMVLYLPRSVVNDVTAAQLSPLLAAFVTYHIFAVNYPHFAASYQIAYRRLPYTRDDRPLPKMLRLRYRFALIYFPILYVLYCTYALSVQTPDGLVLLGFLINLMYLTVGWHYCKQCFGILMVLSAVKHFYFTVWDRRILLAHVMLIWIVTWLRGNIFAYESQYWGLPFHSFGLVQWMEHGILQAVADVGMKVIYALLVVSVAIIALRGWRSRTFPSLTAMLGYFMIYPLLLTMNYFHPLWLWILPAVHSLQYLLFVTAYRRGEVAHMFPAKAPGEEAPGHSVASMRLHALASFAALAVLIGAIQFSWLPHLLGTLVNPEATYHIPLMFMALCHLFINIHHYFIDNVIWRKENPEVARNLMGKVA